MKFLSKPGSIILHGLVLWQLCILSCHNFTR